MHFVFACVCVCNYRYFSQNLCLALCVVVLYTLKCLLYMFLCLILMFVEHLKFLKHASLVMATKRRAAVGDSGQSSAYFYEFCVVTLVH